MQKITSFFSNPVFIRLGGEVFWVGCGQFAVALGGLVGIRLLTSVLDPAGFGELALGATAATLVLQTSLTPLSGSCLRFFPSAQEEGQGRSFLSAVYRMYQHLFLLITCLSVVVSVVFVVFFDSKWLPLLLLSFVYALLLGSSTLLDGLQNAMRHRVVVAWHNGAGVWLRFGAAYLLVMYFGCNSAFAMGGYAVAALLVLGSQLLFFYQKIMPLVSVGEQACEDVVRKWRESLFGYASPFAKWGVFVWALAAADRWALMAFSTTDDVGVYSALWQIGYYPMVILFVFVSQMSKPLLFNRAGSGVDGERTAHANLLNDRLTWLLVIVMAFAVLVGWLWARSLFVLLTSEAYWRGYVYLPIMILSGGLFALTQNLSHQFMINNRTHVLVIPKIILSVVGVGLVFAGAFWRGLFGVVLARLLASFLVFVYHFILCRIDRKVVIIHEG